ncbi:NAD(+)--dinitrogen-reductase ADP-D-ribosyltransferase [Novipirellula artificiosorum]|uniref:NAD(+)--dinitrogen-reductase ADP-D-ribosyltransferase n=1 Tax=Novipirellula artificiosorum TaxID=2528016 RepID=A0A5C6E452_9BACT|nr:NAD(+)--dinitrogen-reductase ADP-D-ribosyltransferase [Novipirellula artificiosorum]TWU42216.1 NAD(+)--dinitrogen-reductase ADP-D-ribosyltransferase [Novipirellula artificiosorum]
MPVSTPQHSVVNLCNLPPWVIASEEYNEHPVPLSLSGVREANAVFFKKIADVEQPHDRGRILDEFMNVKFRLHEWKQHSGSTRRGLRNSYIRFFNGWGVDSNSIEGAVLKDWVRSRFGLQPTYHRGRLLGTSDDDDYRFAVDRMKGMACTNSIHSQFDLLYEFCQYELRLRYRDAEHLKLYRGTYDAGEYDVIRQEGDRRSCVRLNNLSSFTTDRECAWEFGSRVWEVEAPISKIIFFSDLLPNSILRGEHEYLVIGGEFRVREMIY